MNDLNQTAAPGTWVEVKAKKAKKSDWKFNYAYLPGVNAGFIFGKGVVELSLFFVRFAWTSKRAATT